MKMAVPNNKAEEGGNEMEGKKHNYIHNNKYMRETRLLRTTKDPVSRTKVEEQLSEIMDRQEEIINLCDNGSLASTVKERSVFTINNEKFSPYQDGESSYHQYSNIKTLDSFHKTLRAKNMVKNLKMVVYH